MPPDLGIFAMSYKMLAGSDRITSIKGKLICSLEMPDELFSAIDPTTQHTSSSRKPSLHRHLFYLNPKQLANDASPPATDRLCPYHSLHRHNGPPRSVPSRRSSSDNIHVSLPAQARSRSSENGITWRYDCTFPPKRNNYSTGIPAAGMDPIIPPKRSVIALSDDETDKLLSHSHATQLRPRRTQGSTKDREFWSYYYCVTNEKPCPCSSLPNQRSNPTSLTCE